jgi:hypothetical protein
VRLADVLFRQGHLADEALADALMTGVRPAHLDRCDLCGERTLAMHRWLNGVKATAVDTAERAFPAERLAAQQAQILRRLEQLDEPSRVIAFPHASRPATPDPVRRRVAPVWVGVAAAAGLVLGAIGGQMSARLDQPGTLARSVAPPPAAPASAIDEPDPSVLFDMDFGPTPDVLQEIDEITPRLAAIQSSGG